MMKILFVIDKSGYVEGVRARFLGDCEWNAFNPYVPWIIYLPPSFKIMFDLDVIKHCLSWLVECLGRILSFISHTLMIYFENIFLSVFNEL